MSLLFWLCHDLWASFSSCAGRTCAWLSTLLSSLVDLCFSMKETLAGFFGSVAFGPSVVSGRCRPRRPVFVFYQQKCSWSAGSFCEKPTAVVPDLHGFPRRTTGGQQNVGPKCQEVYLACAGSNERYCHRRKEPNAWMRQVHTFSE